MPAATDDAASTAKTFPKIRNRPFLSQFLFQLPSGRGQTDRRGFFVTSPARPGNSEDEQKSRHISSQPLDEKTRPRAPYGSEGRRLGTLDSCECRGATVYGPDLRGRSGVLLLKRGEDIKRCCTQREVGVSLPEQVSWRQPLTPMVMLGAISGNAEFGVVFAEVGCIPVRGRAICLGDGAFRGGGASPGGYRGVLVPGTVGFAAHILDAVQCPPAWSQPDHPRHQESL